MPPRRAARDVGTPIAQLSAVAPVDSLDADAGRHVIERRIQHLAVFGRRESAAARAGGFIVLASALAVLAHGGLPWWRVAAVAGVLLVVHLFHGFMLREPLTADDIQRRFVALTVVGQIGLVLFATLTGGLRSPLTPALTTSIVMSMIFFGPRGVTWRITTMLAVMCGVMAVLPASVTGPVLPTSHLVLATMIGLTWTLIVLHLLVTLLHRASVAALVSLDATREARVSEAEDQTRRLKTVGSRVAHELKNPLAAIKGLIQLVARTPDSERTQERLEVVQQEISRMQAILDEYLSFARPLEDLRPEHVDVAVLAREVAGVLGGRLEQGGIKVELDLAPARVEADPRRLRDAITNLLTNAIEATPRGGAIRMRTHPTDGRGEPAGARIEIEDSGRGIAPADLERLGTSYFTTRVGGTGLGVVLVQGVVMQHGGELTYESTVGRGTMARIDLPAKPPQASPLPDAPGPTASATMLAADAPVCAPLCPPQRLGEALRRRIVERRT